MTFRPIFAGALGALLAGCTASGGAGLVASNPQEACEIEASLLFGLPVKAVTTTSVGSENGQMVVMLDLSGGTAKCVIGPDRRVESIELQ